MGERRPLIGITCRLDERDARVRRSYVDAIAGAGCVPVLFAAPRQDTVDLAEHAASLLDSVDGVVLSGGFDPITEAFGAPTHDAATPEDSARQALELGLLEALDRRPDVPVLGVCLGMQYMALHAGGALDQHMPETTPTHADHMDDRRHDVVASIPGDSVLAPAGEVGRRLGAVTSWHRQAVSDAGAMRVVARSPDSIIEAIDDPERPFYLGVQWHPERTDDPALGGAIYERFARTCAASRAALA